MGFDFQGKEEAEGEFNYGHTLLQGLYAALLL